MLLIVVLLFLAVIKGNGLRRLFPDLRQRLQNLLDELVKVLPRVEANRLSRDEMLDAPGAVV